MLRFPEQSGGFRVMPNFYRASLHGDDEVAFGRWADDRLFEPFARGTNTFLHGYTWGGHPVAAAVALANLDLLDQGGVIEKVRANEAAFRATKQTFNADESERLLRGFLSRALFDAGLYCRADDRGDPVIQLAPPLIIGPPEFDQIEAILRRVLTEAWSIL